MVQSRQNFKGREMHGADSLNGRDSRLISQLVRIGNKLDGFVTRSKNLRFVVIHLQKIPLQEPASVRFPDNI